jgi:calcineurin-like phosphoesterase family protein
MNAVILDNINSTVKPDDTLFHLGDVSFGRGSRKWDWWLSQIRCQTILIKGSHDKGYNGPSSYYHRVGKTQLLLSHEYWLSKPADTFTYMSQQAWIIHGHTHDRGPFINPQRRQVCVSLEKINYKPISLDSILNLIYSNTSYKEA